MKMAKRGPMRRVTMCPYLAWRLRRISSSSNNGWRSHKKLPSMGMAKGPGGSFFLLELQRRLRVAKMQREIRMMNQVSIFSLCVTL